MLKFKLRTVCIPFFHMNAISVRPESASGQPVARTRGAATRRRRLSVEGFCMTAPSSFAA